MDDGIRVGVGNPVFFILRVLLAAALLWFVYGETGWATTLALALVYINTEAIAAGCRCPRMDNGHGRGYMGGVKDEQGRAVFVIRLDCPVHGEEKNG